MTDDGMNRTAEERLADAVRTLMRALTIRAQDDGGDGRLDLSGPELHLIGRLSEQPGLTGRELSAFLCLTPTTIQSMLDRLVRRGLVARTSHPEDGRAIALTLTEEGAATIHAIHARDVTNCAAMLEALPASRRDAFVRDIDLIAEKVDQTR